MKKPYIVEVQSSNISKLIYDGKDLEIEFANGKSYVYESVPLSIFLEFSQAESVGSYFHKNIKNNYKNGIKN